MSKPGQENTLQFKSTRFGDLEVPSDSVVEIEGGMIGFPKETRYVLLEYNPPFSWLHSVENPDLAFVVINASDVGDYYVSRLPLAGFELSTGEIKDLSAINVVAVRPNPADSTINLKAPVIVNVVSRKGKQIILEDPECSTRLPLLAPENTKAE